MPLVFVVCLFDICASLCIKQLVYQLIPCVVAVATAQFSTEKDWEMAMRRNKNFIGWYLAYSEKK